jgi:hypothetical protein
MRTAVRLVVLLSILAVWVGCTSVTPVAVRAGDICEGCKRPILNVKIAAEIVPPNGMALKFRTVSCMARYLSRYSNGTTAQFVTDYRNGRLIRAQSAVYVRSEIDDNTKELDYYAFGDVRSAVAFSQTSGGSATDWPSILKRVAAAGAN